MQEVQNTIPNWIKTGYFVDVKDKQGQWRVSLIMNCTKTHIRVRYDGWSSKYDENFPINSSSIKPFRSVIKGYTGPSDVPGHRQHYQFSQNHHKLTYEVQIEEYIKNVQDKSQFELTQFIRGSHYSWLDYLMTLTYKNLSQITLVYQYFFKHFNLLVKYFKDMLSCDNLDMWFDGIVDIKTGLVNEGRKAFADSYYQIMDTAYTIMEGYHQRLKNFFKSNQTLIHQYITQYQNHLQFMTQYLNQLELNQIFQQVIDKINADNKSSIKLSFMTAITRLFYILEKTIKDKQKKKEIAHKLCLINLRQCGKMNEIAVRQQQIQIQKIYGTTKLILLKYNWKSEIFSKFQLINIKLWRSLIISQKLQRKIKGITKLKNYYNNVTALITKKQAYIIYNMKQNVDLEFKKLQIISAIFYENQHHEIIKKGCELVTQMHKQKGISVNQFQIIWKSSRHRLEAVRKVMYFFFQSICKDLNFDQLMSLVKWVIQQNITEQIDKNFFYSLFKQILSSAKEQKTKILKILFQYSQRRLVQNRQEIKQFAQLLTMQKSMKFKFLKQYSNKFITLIPIQASHDLSLFYIRLVNLIYDQLPKNGQLQLQVNCFQIVYNYLLSILKSKVKRQNVQQYSYKREKLRGLLKLIENLQDQFDLQIEQFANIWKLFDEQQNLQFRQTQFLTWIIQTTYTGALRIQNSVINPCLKQQNLKKELFNTIFKKHDRIDFVQINEIQFKIFKKFQMQVNMDQGIIQQKVDYLSGIQYFRINQKSEVINGLKQLWDILLNCRNFNVTKKVIKLIKQLYLNYKSEVDVQFRKKKLQELLNRIHRHISQDGIKKSNTRLIKIMLYFINQIVSTIKQNFKGHYQNPIFHHHHKSKRTIKLVKDQKQVKQVQVFMNDSIKNLKNLICREFNAPSYNLKMYKTFFTYKKIDEEGNDVPSDEASAGASSHTQFYTKNSPKYNLQKFSNFEQIPNQLFYAPITCLMLSQNEPRINIIQKPNVLYELLSRYICEKMSQYLLRILGDTQTYSKQSSQLAYHILIQIPSNMQAFQILNNLINQLKMKNKDSLTNLNQINLSSQSINFRMYFCKNINRLKEEQFSQFLSESNIKLYQDIFKQLSKRIVESEQIQLIIEVIILIKKALSRGLIHQNVLNVQNVFSCLINLIQFIIGPKQTEQFKKQQRSQHSNHQIKVFHECWTIIQAMFYKQKYRIIDFIVQSQHFQKLVTYVFKNMPRRQFAQIFAHKLQYFFNIAFTEKKKLEQKTQQKICYIMFDVLYYDITKKKTKKNSAFFKIIRDLIMISSNNTSDKLFNKNGDNPSFWQNCLNIIKQQSDFYNQQQKDNISLNGHLLILESLIRKNPYIADINICKLILYSCLCYKQGETIGQDVKCISKNSICAALSVLIAISQCGQNLMKFIISQLRKYQQIQYWRIPQFWHVNLDYQLKSQSGFVGLQNPGCICYLNSFTQTLFMNQQFRNKVINFNVLDESKDYSLLIQLRKIFLNLQYSNQKYLNPVPFTLTIKNNEDKPMIKLYQQMDIQQYSSILFDKIQKLLPKDQDFVKQIFGGTYSNDIISQQCKHSSQRQENFLSMQLDVKSNLQQSLKTLVKGEILQGQNAYFCQNCNKKVKAIKRMSIKKLPNYLIICLKRFQYNFDLDQKIKVNSYCQFGKQISLQAYSQQYLNSLNQQQLRIEELETQTQPLPHEYFDYRLKGVIIHTGSSESGHYYTFIQTEPNKWLQFNDSTITEFDVQRLGEEAFGSDDPMNPKFRNAYMLIYERKKKIQNIKNEPQKMQIQTSPNFFTQEAQHIYNKIKNQNKQIRTFQMMFSQQYNQFIQSILTFTICSSKQLVHQIKSNYGNQHQDSNKQLNQAQNKQANFEVNEKGPLSKETIIDVLKYYFEYCMFIRSRQINIQLFIENLWTLVKILSSQYCSPVLEYILRQFSQKLLIQQFFVQISFKQKLIIISHFFCQIIRIRIRNRKKNIDKQLIKSVIRLIESFLIVIIQNGNCVNQLMYIIRTIAQQDKQLLTFFQRLNIFGIVFQILFGLNQSEVDKQNRIQILKKEVSHILRFYGNQDSKDDQKSDSQMQQQQAEYAYFNMYQIYPVKKTGKCVLKQQSPQQAWNYMYYIYKNETELCKDIDDESQDFQKQNSNISVSSLINLLMIRRSNYQAQFLKLKDARITHLIQQSHGIKAITSLSLFFCQLMHENLKITHKILPVFKKSFKNLDASKFRPYLILIYHMVMHVDKFSQTRNQYIIQILCYALNENGKFFSQLDILHQWVMKMALVSNSFAQSINRCDEGNQLINQIISKIDIFKKPSAQLMKKQKNPTFERLNYQYHGLVVSTDYEDYEKLYQLKKAFFNSLFHQNAFPYQLTNPYKLATYYEPNYEQLIHEIKPGDIMYMFVKKWIRILIINNKFGLLKFHKIVKDYDKKNSTIDVELHQKKHESKSHILRIGQLHIDIGQQYRLSPEQHSIWENQQKLRFLRVIESNKKTQNIQEQKQNYNPKMKSTYDNRINVIKIEQNQNKNSNNPSINMNQDNKKGQAPNKKQVQNKQAQVQNNVRSDDQIPGQTSSQLPSQSQSQNHGQSPETSSQMIGEQNSSDVSYQSSNE